MHPGYFFRATFRISNSPQDDAHIQVKIVWVSGHFSVVSLKRQPSLWENVPRYSEMLQRIHSLWQQGFFDHDIARTLNQEGLVTIDGGSHNRVSVLRLRLRKGWQHRSHKEPHPETIDGLYTVRGLANACHTDPAWIRWRIHDKTIAPDCVSKHPQRQLYLIDADDTLIDALRLRAANRKHDKPQLWGACRAGLGLVQTTLDRTTDKRLEI